MKTKISGKMILFIIISCALVVIGTVVGCVCHFTADGFFNYGMENRSTKTISVSYYITDYSDVAEVEKVCEDEFSRQGIKYEYEENSEVGGTIEYVFSYGTDSDKLLAAADSITTAISVDGSINFATFNEIVGNATNVRAYKFAAIAAASIIAIQFIYCIIRFKLNMAVLSLVSNVHYILLALALIAAFRIPFSSYAAGIIVFGLLLSVMLLQIFFTHMKGTLKSEEDEDLSFKEKTNKAYSKSLKISAILACSLFVIAALFAVMMVSFSTFAMYAFVGIAGMLVCAIAFYSATLFSPAVYSGMEHVAVSLRTSSRGKKEQKTENVQEEPVKGSETV